VGLHYSIKLCPAKETTTKEDIWMNGQKVYEKVLNRINYQGSANQNQKEVSSQPS
jgi:hypothetical protein